MYGNAEPFSEEVHDKIAHILGCINHKLTRIHCKVSDSFAGGFKSISCRVDGSIDAMLSDVLTKDHTTHCQAANNCNTRCSGCNFGSGTPAAATCSGSFGRCGPRRLRDRVGSLGHWHEHRLANLGCWWHIHRDERALLTWIWHLDGCAWGTRWHVDHSRFSRWNERLGWGLPLEWRANVALLPCLLIDLFHFLEVVDVILSAQVELCRGEACHESSLQDLILLFAVVLPITTELYLEMARHGFGYKKSVAVELSLR
mmetsp:Transcript_34017/g.59177  ORF Transcript_34017/g.59177 Transcript_34017/m.59177 type:complete len:257 (-) Transcript_34017:46-816(-)